MRIVKHKPAARGVSQLMYVGDADVAPAIPTAVKIAIGLVVGWWLLKR